MKLGDPTTVGTLMRERRKKLGFSILQMAEATGLSPITIMRIELGRVSYIHAKTARALEVPKKIEKRLVMQNVAVMRDGPDVVLPPLSTMMATRSSGDTEAIEQDDVPDGSPEPAKAPPVRLNNKPIAKRPKPVVAPSKPFRKRLYAWLSEELGRMAR